MADGTAVLLRKGASQQGYRQQAAEPRSETDSQVHVIPDAFTQVGILDKSARVKIDRVIALDGLAIVTGWRTREAEIAIPGTRFWTNYRRPDVEQQFGLSSTGFTAVVEVLRASQIDIHLAASGRRFKTSVEPAQDASTLNTVLAEQKPRLHTFVPALIASRKWGVVLTLLVNDSGTHDAKGHIDKALWVKEAGIAVSGWAFASDPSSLYLVAADGYWLPLSRAEPIPRKDVQDAEIRQFVADTGFYACIHGDFSLENDLLIVSAQRGGFFLVFKGRPDKAPLDPVEFARCVLTEPTPRYRFAARVKRHDLKLIDALLKRKDEFLDNLPVDRWEYGQNPVVPDVSVIVPLYGRWDFVEHQLLEFCSDEEFGQSVELIYVVDDPAILSAFMAAAQELYDLYGVPFTVLWGQANRGYSGANNIGAEAAKGCTIIFLNSDAFPNQPGWASELASQLEEHTSYGVVTPRLLFPDGGLQHCGMRFRLEGVYKVWVNDHPFLGLPPKMDRATALVEQVAVTGACMAVRREQFLALGGFDTGYLIGDFEDSDLCLKYRKAGLLPGYYPHVNLTHLERQSFCGIGTEDFRNKVTIFNAVRHASRWESLIEQLAAPQSRETV